MAGLVSGLFTLTKLYEQLNNQKHNVNSNSLLVASTNGDIGKLLSNFIIEPTIFISKNLKDVDITSRVIYMNTQIFSAFYAQAFQVLNNIYGVGASETIELLASGHTDFNIMNQFTTYDDFDKRMTFTGESLNNPNLRKDYVAELYNTKGSILSTEDDKKPNKSDDKDYNSKIFSVNPDKKASEVIHSILNTQFEITVKMPATTNPNPEEGTKLLKEVIVPITVKTHILYVNSSDLLAIATPRTEDKSFFSRWNAWRAGSIGFSDLLFAGDLIKEYKEGRVKDKARLMDKVESKRASSTRKIATTMGVGRGFEKLYNMYIISDNDAKAVEPFIRASLMNEKGKEKFLDQCSGLSLSIIDTEYEKVILGMKDLYGVNIMTWKDLEKKSEASQLTEIFKSLLVNKMPQF